MNGYRFYADIPGTRGLPEKEDVSFKTLLFFANTQQHVNCLAVEAGRPSALGHRMAIGADSLAPNDKASEQSPNSEYLRRCRRIPENIARKLHPRLFERLDAI